MNDGYDIDSLKVLIKRCYALDASFARADSYPKTDNPRRSKNTSAIGSSSGSASSSSGNRSRSSSNPPKPRTNDTRPKSFLKLSASDLKLPAENAPGTTAD
ncbi:hypothetical protein D6D15_10610 [Aureobasidium pullulans]|uniref:Uncharacterized protein n=1 Tax=Aureobasidium pullulans TaxID=5580 RepID=A0A4S9APS8_AURPU|nr:hypothetical protein D6D15_10610 [Aureobasidium pullulans]